MTLCLLLFGVTTSWAEEGDYKELFTVTSDDVVTNSTYTAYSTTVKDCGDWIVTFGGNNLSVGTNKNNHTKCTLANYTKYAVSPVKATDYASAFVSTSELDNVGKITFSISGGSYQTNTDVYVIYSSDGETFTQLRTKSDLVCKVCPIADKTLYEFEFAKLSGYFGLLFKEATPNTSQNWRIDNVSITLYEEVTISTTPSINASNVELAADATSGTISYSISNPVEGKSISASTTADWISNFAYTDNTVTFTTKANTTTAARTANITLTYDGAKDKVVTITQKGKPFDTIESMYVAAVKYGSTATSSTIKFGNWVVSGVAGNNANNAYVTDGTNGFIIYAKDHGFEVGDILSGTVTCSLQLYKGSAELTNITSTTTGLTVKTGGTVTPKETTIDKLSGLNTGAVIVLKGVNYDGTNFTDGTNSIQPYKTFMTLPAFDKSKKYNVTGVYIQFDATKEIAPRSEADIEDVAAAKYSITVAEGIEHGTVTPNVTSAIEGTKVTLTIKPETHYELSTLTITDSNGGNVEYNEADYTFKMPACDVTVSATFAESAKYYVMYSSLGEEVGDEEVYDGECIANAPKVTAPEGWEFAGWTADETFTTSTAVPTYFTDETPVTQDTILYAVFSKGGSGSIAYHKVTTDLDDWRGDYLIAYSDEIFMDGSLEGGTNGVGKAQSHVNPTDSLSGNTILAEWGDKYYVTLEAIDDSDLSKGYVIKSHSDKTPYFYQTSNKNGMSGTANKETAANYPISVVFNDENDIDIALGGDAEGAILHYNNTNTGNMFRFYKDGGQQNIYLYKKDANTMLYTITNPIYTRSGLTSNNLGTICLPCDATITGAQAYEVSSMTMNGDNISSITFSPVEKVEGGKGYLFKASATELTAEYISEAKTEDDNNNGLVGSLEGTDVAEGKYIINNNKVKKCGTDCKIAANRAYIDPAKYVGELSAKGETITIELETPTSINELMQKVTAPGQWYSLNGQPVAQPTKGVFTKNGVKYIFK